MFSVAEVGSRKIFRKCGHTFLHVERDNSVGQTPCLTQRARDKNARLSTHQTHGTPPPPPQGEPLRDVGLVVGEFGAADTGDNGVANADTTAYSDKDRAWLKLLGRYLNGLSWQNGPASWMWWSWNVSARGKAGRGGSKTA